MQKRVLSKYDGKKYGWFFQMKELLLMVILAVLVFRFVIGVSRVVGSSMYPELEEGDIVLYTRLGSDYAYGDIVFVKMPSGEQFVKRVVALGGDTVDIRDGRLYVNDKEEADTSMVKRQPQRELRIRIPWKKAGYLFLATTALFPPIPEALGQSAKDR